MRFIVFCILVISSCAHKPVLSYSQNSYWHELVNKVELGKSTLSEVLAEENPFLLEQIKSDALEPILLSLWGESLNYDSGAKKKIIDDKILSQLQDFFQVKNDLNIVPAGIAHSYGYLFSNLDTPYGYKRKRWIDQEVNQAFNLLGKSLSPETKEGTLLSNLTYFAGEIAFELPVSRNNLQLIKNVSSEIKSYAFSELKIKVLIENIEGNINQHKILKTFFIKYPNKAAGFQNEYLILYLVEDLDLHSEKLISIFPITREFYLKATDPLLMGDDRPIMPRYNLSLSIGKDVRLSGRRRVIVFKIR